MATPEPVSHGAEPRRVPSGAFVAVALGCSALQAAFASRVFLFWDDFYFLGEARESSLTWGYLGSDLFTHFSPITRLVNWAVVGHLAAHPWVVPAAQGLMLSLVVCSATWLLVALFDRTVLALVSSVVLGVSLTLVPLGSWWTAGANILPGMAGFLVAFAASVLVVRGRSRWWAVPALAGAAVGVLDYETPILLPGYLLLWVLLFRERVSEESPRALVRRTWWLLLGIAAISGAAALNYRLNYYSSQPAPPVGELLGSLARSWGSTLVPTVLGLHPLTTGWLEALTPVVGWLVTLLVVGWLLTTRRGAWRGLAFAVAGWSVPTLAVLLNRLERYGPGVADDAIYVYLPTVLVLVGLLEAVRAPRRRAPSSVPRAALVLRWAVPVALVGVVAAYAVSVGPTSRYRILPGTSGDFVATARASAADARKQVGRFSVIDSLTHSLVMPDGYGRYSRDSNVLGLTVPGLAFDDPRPPYYRFDDRGRLRPATVEELASIAGVRAGPAGPLQVRGAEAVTYDAGSGTCFTTTGATHVRWRFDPVAGDDLVVLTHLSVDATTTMTLRVVSTASGRLEHPYPIDPGTATLHPTDPGTLEIVDFPTLMGVQLQHFTPGVGVCVQSLAVGQVESAAGP